MNRPTLASLMTMVVAEADAAIDAAFAAHPELQAELDRFVTECESSCIRCVIDITPRAAFRVEAIRVNAGAIEAKVVAETIAPPREALGRPVAGCLH